MNLNRFLRDFKTGRKDVSTLEAIKQLGINRDVFRQLLKAGVIKPIEGGMGSGKRMYFSQEDIVKLKAALKEYR